MNEYYVYMFLREDGTPYYIGKGKGNRAYSTWRNVKVPSEDRILFVLKNLTEQQAFDNEREFITWYGRKDNNTGILRNLTDGGEGPSGAIKSEETRKKLSDANKGKVISEEHKRKISNANKDRKLTEEHKKKLNIPCSEDHKRKISESVKNLFKNEEHVKKLKDSRKPRWYINNSKISKLVDKKLIIPEGWVRGRLPLGIIVKYDDELIDNILKDYNFGVTKSEIGKRYKIHRKKILKIIQAPDDYRRNEKKNIRSQ